MVVLDRNYYSDKVKTMLNDTNVYKKQKENIDNKFSCRVKNFICKHRSILTKKEIQYVINTNYNTANIYGLPKIHKSKTIKDAIAKSTEAYIQIEKPPDLPFRYITGGPNAPTTNLSLLLNILLKPYVKKVKSHIQDSTDFLNKLERFKNEDLSDILLVTVDVVNMYNSIKKELGIKALTYYLYKYPELLNQRYTPEFVLEGMEIILDNNLCQFDGEYYTQISGTFTGTIVAPTYSTLALAYLEIILEQKLSEKYSEEICAYIVQNWKRYLDDGFISWKRNFGDIKIFMNILNSLDENINFTYEVNEDKISYLNVLVYKGTNGLESDIYYKETDSREYLPFNSCHQHHTKENIPFTLSKMICTIVEDRTRCIARLEDLKMHLNKCGYPYNLINSAITKAMSIPLETLRTVKGKKEETVLVFVTTHNPRNPNVSQFINNAVELLKNNSELNKIYGKLKLIKSKREPPSLGNLLTKSLFITNKRISGINKCKSKRCKTCINIVSTDNYYFSKVNYKFYIRENFDCTIKNCIYVLTCLSCKLYYIGKTVNLRQRMTTHRACILEERDLFVSKHIALCNFNKKDKFTVTPFYKMKREGIVAHLTTEEYFIRKFKPDLNMRI
ncbi:MAG: GIY-YIG nuclease family protein [Campylobacteraceae bacterium]|nr:GIY-YIG nuclease family protein [Campylobacteraceae bacterium]